jgi:hypothetical protein
MRSFAIVSAYKVRCDIEHVIELFPGVLFVTEALPLDEKLMTRGVVIFGAGCNYRFGGPSFMVGLNIDALGVDGCPVGIAAIRLDGRDMEGWMDAPSRWKFELNQSLTNA